MPTSPTAQPTLPPTVWLVRGRHLGPAAADALRKNLRLLKDTEVIRDWLEVPESESSPDERIFEARWSAGPEVTVRARLTLTEDTAFGQDWTLVAEAEQPWDQRWPSPATMFWPQERDTSWDHEATTRLRFLDTNQLPEDDKELRRLLRSAVRGSWAVHLVVHEAMTPDQRGRRPLTPLLGPGLHHRVVEHRAAPHQLRSVNWALREFGVELPRGGAVVLPGTPAAPGYDASAFSVRSVFLDGSEPTELLDAVTRFAASPRPLPTGAEAALTQLREDWRLLTLEEELERERKLVAMYAEALEAMTQSRDLYREAAERANEALAAYREGAGTRPSATRAGGSPLQQLTRTLERFKAGPKGRPWTAPSTSSTSSPSSATDIPSPTATPDEPAGTAGAAGTAGTAGTANTEPPADR
ncbi:hypothetical protein [Streptomyces adustus]|uniref:hypothetical protein n=1 Tax=Streptomyces adustus TaxID=1609272 RepID=UPI001EE4E109|nr:hypothetical protein [Streptomyces adustus]